MQERGKLELTLHLDGEPIPVQFIGYGSMSVLSTLQRQINGNLRFGMRASAPMAQAESIEVWKTTEAGHPYPWRFAVTFAGQRHVYAGVPNKCATEDEAFTRARERLEWLRNGTHAQKYSPDNATGD